MINDERARELAKHNVITILESKLSREFLSDIGETPESIADFYLSMPYVTKDAPMRIDNLMMVVAFRFLATIQYRKEGTYGSSWCKRGEMDVFFNLARKFDRIENIQLNGAKDEVGEAKIDTVGDMANYGMLWMTLFLTEKPKAFMEWVENNLN